MSARRLILRDWEAAAWQAGMLSAVVRPFRSRYDWYVEDGQPFYREYVHAEPDPVSVPCPLGDRGQRLWVAESWCMETEDYEFARHRRPAYKADGRDYNDYDGALVWRSPATMPQWASRSEAVHQGSRLVQVQSVTEAEALACGIQPDSAIDYRRTIVDDRVVHSHLGDKFRLQFIADHGQAAWDANVWVWVHRIGRAS